MWYLAASAIGFVVGATNGFLLNRRWTFRDHVGDALTPVRWGVVQGCGLGVNEALLYLFVHDAHLDKLLAQVFATAVVTVSTFFVNRAWTFRVHAPGRVADRRRRRAPLSGRRPAARARRGCVRRGAISAASSVERALEQPVDAARAAPTGRGSTRSSWC